LRPFFELEEMVMSTNPETAIADPLDFTITDVTARSTIDVQNVDGHRTAGDVATSMASLMELPASTPYSLRDDARARMLVDDVAVGRQVRPGARLVVIPKAHLA
jgi:hypothetical protein